MAANPFHGFDLTAPRKTRPRKSAPSGERLVLVMARMPRRLINAVSSRATRRPEIEVSGIAARHSRVTSSTMFRMRSRRPQTSWSWTKSTDQRAFGLDFDQDRPPARPRSAPPGPPLAHREAFFAIKPVDAIDAGPFAVLPQQDEQTRIIAALAAHGYPVSAVE